MATESILMAAVEAGGDRQELHERIRRHSMAVSEAMNAKGAENDLLARIAADPAFSAVKGTLGDVADPAKFVGRSPRQVDEFLRDMIEPALRKYRDALGMDGRLRT